MLHFVCACEGKCSSACKCVYILLSEGKCVCVCARGVDLRKGGEDKRKKKLR